MSASEVSGLLPTLRNFQVIRYDAVVSVSLLAYENCITFDLEYNYLFKSKRSFVKIPYILTRYYALFFVASWLFQIINFNLHPSLCKTLSLNQAWSIPPFALLIDIILVIRIYALYGRTNQILIVLSCLMVSEAIALFTIYAYAVKPFKLGDHNPLPYILTNCSVVEGKPVYRLTLAFLAVSSAFQAIYLGLTLYKVRQTVMFGNMRLKMSPLYTILTRDGVGYFVIILGVNIMNVFLERFGAIELSSIGSGWTVALPSILACRLIFNIRSANTHAAEQSGLQATPFPVFKHSMMGTETGTETSTVRSVYVGPLGPSIRQD